MPITETILLPLSNGADTTDILHTNVFESVGENINLVGFDANTRFLLQLNTNFTDITGQHSPTARNGANITTVDPIWGAGSSLHTGVESISFPDHDDFAWAGKNCTLELFFKPSSLSSSQDLWGQHDSYTPFLVTLGTNGKMTLFVSPGDGWSILQTGTFVMSVGTAYHLALEKYGTRWRVYVGPVGGSGNVDIDVTNAVVPFNSTRDFRIGTWRGDATGAKGRIDEAKLSDVARYQGAFTPGTGPFPAYATSASPTALAKSLPVGAIVKWSTARVVAYKNGVVQTDPANTYYKMQKAVNDGLYNGTWLTLTGLRALSNDTITTTTNSVKVLGQYNSDGSYGVSTSRGLFVEVDLPSGGGNIIIIDDGVIA